ncbi:hypothetical protein SDC9_144313 [bioreactor metagenome]|uniref:Uncharacterized protein n=1 Tax=bioreactor metagenome TaxID=1076179 RepID=A0A645E5R8_9ZZZZ
MLDRAREPVRVSEHRNGATRRSAGRRQAGADDVGEHRTRVHRGQLMRVTDHDQPRAGAQRGHQRRHQIKRDHRHLIDDQQIVRQRIAGVTCHASAWTGPQQRMQGGGRLHLKMLPDRTVPVGAAQRRVQGLLHTGRGLAGERGQRDAGAVGHQIVQDAQQPGDGGGLAGPRTARDDAGPGAHRGVNGGALVCGQFLSGGSLPRDPHHGVGDGLPVEGRRRQGDALRQCRADSFLGLPVAFQIEPVADQPERALIRRGLRADHHQWRLGEQQLPPRRVGPR